MYLVDFWTASRGEVSVFDLYGLLAVAILNHPQNKQKLTCHKNLPIYGIFIRNIARIIF